MLEALQFEFMQNALIAGLLASVMRRHGYDGRR